MTELSGPGAGKKASTISEFCFSGTLELLLTLSKDRFHHPESYLKAGRATAASAFSRSPGSKTNPLWDTQDPGGQLARSQTEDSPGLHAEEKGLEGSLDMWIREGKRTESGGSRQ